MRINVQLIDSTTGFQVWADDFTGEMKDVFSLQEQTALNIAESLNLKLSPQEQQAIQHRIRRILRPTTLFCEVRRYMSIRPAGQTGGSTSGLRGRAEIWTRLRPGARRAGMGRGADLPQYRCASGSPATCRGICPARAGHRSTIGRDPPGVGNSHVRRQVRLCGAARRISHRHPISTRTMVLPGTTFPGHSRTNSRRRLSRQKRPHARRCVCNPRSTSLLSPWPRAYSTAALCGGDYDVQARKGIKPGVLLPGPGAGASLSGAGRLRQSCGRAIKKRPARRASTISG